MAGGGFSMDTQVTATNVGGKLTLSIIITCIVAASSGLLFGYDIGISGSFFFIIYSNYVNDQNYCRNLFSALCVKLISNFRRSDNYEAIS